MKYIQGQNRAQTYLFPVSLDDAIDPENEVRLPDPFVNNLTPIIGYAEHFVVHHTYQIWQ